MNRFGLAFSRGGFRGVLSQLGPNRFLPDAQIAPQVTHISSVAGGWIIAAHPVLNCNRHIGSHDDFDAAAERSGFVRLDARELTAPFEYDSSLTVPTTRYRCTLEV
jgi:hypothetical protein